MTQWRTKDATVAAARPLPLGDLGAVAVQARVVDRHRGARGELDGEVGVAPRERPLRLRHHEGHDAERAVRGPDRNEQRRAHPHLAQQQQVLVVGRGLLEQRVRDLGVQLGHAGAHDLAQPPLRVSCAGSYARRRSASPSFSGSRCATTTCSRAPASSTRSTAHQSAIVGTTDQPTSRSVCW
jgi:hypothetical protein